MGFRFRQKLKICKGVSINLSKKGFSSITLGGIGAALNIGKKGLRGTAGIPGSGMSYSHYTPYKRGQQSANPVTELSNQYTLPPILVRTQWTEEMSGKARDEEFYYV